MSLDASASFESIDQRINGLRKLGYVVKSSGDGLDRRYIVTAKGANIKKHGDINSFIVDIFAQYDDLDHTIISMEVERAL